MTKTVQRIYLKRLRIKGNTKLTSSESTLRSASEKLNYVRQIIFNIILLSLVLAALYFFIRDVRSIILTVRPVPIPDSLIKQGFNPDIMAARIASHMRYIANNASQVERRWPVIDNGNRPDIQLPGQQISYRTLVNFMKCVGGNQDVTIIADVVEKGDNYFFQVRVDGGEYSGQRYSSSIKKSENLNIYSNRIAEEAMHAAMPYDFAVYQGVEELRNGCMINKTCTFLESLQGFEELLKNRSEKDDKWALLGRSYIKLRLNKLKEASESAKLAIKVDPKFVPAYINLGSSISGMERYEEAKKIYNQALAIDDKSILAHFNLGATLAMAGEHNEAIKKFQHVVDLDWKNVDAYISWGISLAKLKMYEDAIKKFEQANALGQKDIDAFAYWGYSLQELGMHEDAIEKLQKAILLGSKEALTYYSLGNSFRELEKYEEAIVQYSQVIKLNPTHAKSYYLWGISHSDMGNSKEAIVKFRKAVNLDPENADSYYVAWGDSLRNLKRSKDAEEKYRQAVEHNPRNAIAFYNWGGLLGSMKRYQEAAEKFEQAIALDPNDVDAHNALEMTLKKMRKECQDQEGCRGQVLH